jgi:hypothetical protein
MRPAARALGLALLVLLAPLAGLAGASAHGTNPDADAYQDVRIQEDEVTVAAHDRGTMDSALDYEDDDGNVQTLPATVNTSQETPYGVEFDKVDADAYDTFPRVDDEDENAETWTDDGDWTTTSGGSSEMTVQDDSDLAPSGVDVVGFDASVASSETASATFADNVSVDSDVAKRVAQIGMNVNGLTGEVEVRFTDDDGDYYAAHLNGSTNATAEEAIANSTGDGYVFQERLADLPSSGTVEEISEVTVHVDGGDADVELYWVDVERKSTVDLTETVRNEGADDEETTTIAEVNGKYVTDGEVPVTDLATLGSWTDSATVHDLHVYDVRYRVQDLAGDDVSTEFSSADDYAAYSQQLDQTARLSVPTAIDLTHGTLTLEAEQSLVSERYAMVQYAIGTGDTDLGNVSDDDYTAATSSFSNQGDTVELATVTAGENVIVDWTLLYTDAEASALQATGGAAPMGGGGGFLGGLGFGQVLGALGIGGIAVFLRRRLGIFGG